MLVSKIAASCLAALLYCQVTLAQAQSSVTINSLQAAAAARFANDNGLAKLRSAVRLEPAMFSISDGRISIAAQPIRALPLYRQTETAQELETILVEILSKPAGGKPPLLTPAQAERVTKLCTITFGPVLKQRRLSEVSLAEINECVDAYLEQLDRQHTWARYGNVQNKAVLRPSGSVKLSTSYISGSVGGFSWEIEPVRDEYARVLPPITERVRSEARQAANRRFGGDPSSSPLDTFRQQVYDAPQKYSARLAGDLQKLLSDALGVFVHPKHARPLLEAGELSKLTIQTTMGFQFNIPPEYQKLTDSGSYKVASMAPGMRNDQFRQDRSRQVATGLKRGPEPEKISLSRTPALTVNYVSESTDAATEPAQRILKADFEGFQGGSVNALSLSPDGHWLAAAGDVVRIWNLQNGKLEHVLRTEQSSGGGNGFTTVRFTVDGTGLLVAVAGTSRSLRLYDVADFSKYSLVLGGHRGHVERMAFSPRGDHLVTYGVDQTVILWDWYTHKKIAAFSAPNKALHVGADDFGEVMLIDSASRVCRGRAKPREFDEGDVPDRLIEALSSTAAVPSGGKLLPHTFSTGGTNDAFAFGGYSTISGSRKRYWCAVGAPYGKPALFQEKHRYLVTATALNWDQLLCASADATGQILVWNTETGAVLRRFASLATPIYAVSFGESAMQWQFGDTSYGGLQWRRNHYSPVQWQFDLAKRQIRAIARREVEPPVEDSGRTLRLEQKQGTPQKLQVWKGNKLFRELPFEGPNSWDILTYSWLRGSSSALDSRVSEGGDEAIAAATSKGPAPGILVGAEDGSLVYLDAQSLMPRRHFLGHTDRVWSAVESPVGGGKFVLSTGGDGTLKLWSLDNFKPQYNLGVLTDQDDRVLYVYRRSPANGKLQIGDRIVQIDGMAPIDFVQDERSRRAPSGAVPVLYVRGGKRHSQNIELSNMGDVVKPLLSAFVSKTTQEWIVWTENGFYDCSPGANRLLGWHENRGSNRPSTFLAASQIQQECYRPDVIDLILELGDEQRAVAEADRRRGSPSKPPRVADGGDEPPAISGGADAAAIVTPTPLQKIAPAPLVKILAPRQGDLLVTDKPSVVVKVAVSFDAKQSEPNVTYMVNGNPIVATRDPNDDTANVTSGSKRQITAQATVPLIEGENRISAIARSGGTTSVDGAAVVVVRYRPSPEVAKRPKLMLLSIGVNKYEGEEFPSLQFAKADAESMATAVSGMKSNRYGAVEAHRLIDDEATATAIRKKLGALTKLATPGDTLVIHISAHGFIKNGKFYVLPSGGDPEDPIGTCLSWATFLELGASLPNVRLVLLIDTCRSASVASSILMETSAAGDQARTVLAACNPREVSRESSFWRHGVFTLALLEVLGNKPLVREEWPHRRVPDMDGDGEITTEELSGFVRARVRQLTGDEQTPELAKLGTDGDSVLFSVPTRAN